MPTLSFNRGRGIAPFCFVRHTGHTGSWSYHDDLCDDSLTKSHEDDLIRRAVFKGGRHEDGRVCVCRNRSMFVMMCA